LYNNKLSVINKVGKPFSAEMIFQHLCTMNAVRDDHWGTEIPQRRLCAYHQYARTI